MSMLPIPFQLTLPIIKAVRRSVTRMARPADGDVAWVATEPGSSGSHKGKAIDSTGTETMVLRRTGGRGG